MSGTSFAIIVASLHSRNGKSLLSRVLAAEPLLEEIALMAGERVLALAPRVRLG